MKILLIEDNATLANALCDQLSRAGHRVTHAGNLRQALQACRAETFDTIILDLGLPDGDGAKVLEWVRANGSSATGVLILTARDTIEERVAGLRAGADDYLIKPFAQEELLARLETIERRLYPAATTTLRIAELRLDLAHRQVELRGIALPLSAREFDLLEILARRKNKVVAKRLLEDQLFGEAGDLGSNAVEVYVHRLRKRLADADAGLELKTIRGVGYSLRDH